FTPGTRTDALRPAGRNSAVAAGHVPDASGRTVAILGRPRVGDPHGTACRAAPRLPCCLFRGGLPHTAVAEILWRNAYTRAFRHELGGGRHARARAWRTPVQLYGAWAVRVRQAGVSWHRREVAPCGICGRSQLIRARSTLPLGRTCTLAQDQNRSWRPRRLFPCIRGDA